jgi:outer membrane protein insertion porin family
MRLPAVWGACASLRLTIGLPSLRAASPPDAGKGLVSVLALALVVLAPQVSAFRISDIRVEGLQRVSAGSVFGAINVNVGDEVDSQDLRQVIRDLFAEGSFDDIELARDNNVLIIKIKERPSIARIEIEGNKALKTEDLLEGLKDSGLAEGKIFEKVTLEHIRADLERQYVQQGRYGAGIEANVRDMSRNRVGLHIEVNEGENSAIRHINIVGNTLFDDELLRQLFELQLPTWFSIYSKNAHYSKEKLTGDLERLESFYKDRGYLRFTIESTLVSISPNKEDVYVTVNIIEGEKYTVTGVEVAGELHDVASESVQGLILVQEGQVFSQRLMTASEEAIETALGNAGYTFASATGEPEENEEDNGVTVKFFVDAGKRAYVRRIDFRGNTISQDEVLRREMRQMEGGWASTAQIERSKVRLERLGFFKEVNVETPAVPGTDDQVDVNYSVEEQATGSISASLGFAQRTGMILGLSYQQNNVFGTGNSTSIGVNRSDFQTAYNFSFFDPYFTVDGVSRGYSMFFRRSDFNQFNVASFSTDSWGGDVNFGYPITEVSRIGFSVGFERTEITEGVYPAQEISEFLNAEGNDFNLFSTTINYQMSALNRGFLPTGGRSQRVSFDATFPGSELQFFRFNYTGQIFYPLTRNFTLRFRTELGYGDVYGSSKAFPFYKHFFAGGAGSIRGYERNTLGPRSTPSVRDRFGIPDPIGGNLLIEGSAEIIFRLPFVEDQRQMKSAFFVDAGNVFNTSCPLVSLVCNGPRDGELRYSVGFAYTIITGFAPISFSLSYPINQIPGDERESFQFELGTTF